MSLTQEVTTHAQPNNNNNNIDNSDIDNSDIDNNDIDNNDIDIDNNDIDNSDIDNNNDDNNDDSTSMATSNASIRSANAFKLLLLSLSFDSLLSLNVTPPFRIFLTVSSNVSILKHSSFIVSLSFLYD